MNWQLVAIALSAAAMGMLVAVVMWERESKLSAQTELKHAQEQVDALTKELQLQKAFAVSAATQCRDWQGRHEQVIERLEDEISELLAGRSRDVDVVRARLERLLQGAAGPRTAPALPAASTPTLGTS